MSKLQITNSKSSRRLSLKIAVFGIICNLALGISSLYSQKEVVVKMKKAVMIIAQDGFRDEELFLPKEVLDKNGIEVKIASSSLTQAKGMLGARVKPDVLIQDVNARDYDAIVFIGGAGASQYWDDPLAHKLAQDALNTNRILAAICIAPVTLAKAGVLRGKRATVWASEAGQLKAGGASYTGRNVERDGNVITASGPSAAAEFAQELVKAMLY
jgi:protease I